MLVPGITIKFSDTPGELKLDFPDLGQHNQEILSLLGYGSDEVDMLKAKGVI